MTTRPRRTATTIGRALLLALVGGCASSERGGAPQVTADTVVTAQTPPVLAAVTGDVVAPTPVARVTDRVGRPLEGVSVTFAVIEGGGAVDGANATTNADGLAQPLRWTVGNTPGANRLSAIVGSRTVTFTVSAVARPTTEWEWQFVGTPSGGNIEALRLDPHDDTRWYAWGIDRGVFISTDAGTTWRLALDAPGVNANGFVIHPRDSNTLLAAAQTKLYVSTDGGATWNVRYTFPYYIRSLLVSARDGSIFVAPQWPDGAVPGIYKSTDDGRSFTLLPYGVAAGTQILTWHIFEDPKSGDLYTGNEIANHPTPYRPPLLRSQDRGVTWTQVNGTITWHVVKLGADTTTSRLYALAEGPGLYSSTDGVSWAAMSPARVGVDLLVDPHRSGWVYATQPKIGLLVGGVYAASDGGAGLIPVGLSGHHVAGLATNRGSTELFAISYGKGIYKAKLP